MAYDIGPRIGIEGEAEYRQQLQAINQGLRTLGSEMNVVTSQFIGNENSVESLTAKNDVLDRTIYSLNEKLAAQQRMLQESATAYGEADSRTQQWQQVVNKTTAELNKAEAQVRQNTEAIENYGKEEESAGDASEVLKAILGELGISMQALTVAGVVGLAIAALKELVEWMAEAVTGAAEYADNILTLSTNFGIATESLQAYQYMAELTDTSLDTITGSISRLTRSMSTARDGNDATAEAFAKLNIRITDANGQLRDSEAVFNDVITALGYMSNETERDAIAQTLLGRSAMDLNSLIATGRDGIAAYTAEAQRMGYILSGEQLEALGAVDDQFQRMDRMMEAVKNRIAVEMAPALIELTEQLLQIAMQVDWEAFGRAAAAAIRAATPVVITLAEALAGLAQIFAGLMEIVSNFLGFWWGDVLLAPTKLLSSRVGVPGLASGGVVQPNDPALYVLGDNTTEREVVAPESMLRQIAREENGNGRIVVSASYPGTDDQIIRMLAPKLQAYWDTQGVKI